MDSFNRVANWIRKDKFRVNCLVQVNNVMESEWYVAAGFLRNLIWDKLNENKDSTPLNDIDVIYLNPSNTDPEVDRELELKLASMISGYKWSVKNQTRMALKHKHSQYKDCVEAMSYWPEIQTAIGATIVKNEMIYIASPFTAEEVISLSVTKNHKCTTNSFHKRVSEKGWLNIWSNLEIKT